MAFVTTLRLTSGDRETLDDTVADIKQRANRKGVQFKGPHPKPPEEIRVPQAKRLAPGPEFDPWEYSVYVRELRIVGHDEFARETAGREFPDGVRVEVDVQQVTNAGR
jgi:ribosomal protein S10